MAKPRGKPLGVILVLLSGWITARVFLHEHAAVPLQTPTLVAEIHVAGVQQSGSVTHRIEVKRIIIARARRNYIIPLNPETSKSRFMQTIDFSSPETHKDWAIFASTMDESAAQQNIRATDQSLIYLPAHQVKTATSPRESVYGFSFWRGGALTSGLAPASQYGGSQAGLVASYRLSDHNNALVLLWRATITPQRPAEREFALGVRIQPITKLPITLSGERRFRPSGPDRFAFYLAGGQSDVPVIEKFKLDGFAQIGILEGGTLDHFFDAHVQLQRPVQKSGPISISAGGGLWAGGQKGAARIDIGPSVRADIKLGKPSLRVSADWRFRLAGNAKPGNGPAVTVSTGF
jgi:hypothetical protein